MNGILSFAAGGALDRAAHGAADSVRATCPAPAIDRFTDCPQAPDLGLFLRFEPSAGPHRRSRVDCTPKTRFDRAFHLDPGPRVGADSNEMFPLPDWFGFAFAQLSGGVILCRPAPGLPDFPNDGAQPDHTAGVRKHQIPLSQRVRDSDLRPCIRPMRARMGGDHADPNSSPAVKAGWLHALRRHSSETRAHLAGLSGCLMLDPAAGDGWDTLCPFPGLAVPSKPFPHEDRSAPPQRA